MKMLKQKFKFKNENRAAAVQLRRKARWSKLAIAGSSLALIIGVGAGLMPNAAAATCTTTAVTGNSPSCTTPVSLTVNAVLSLSGGDSSITIPAITPGATAVAAEKAGTVMKVLSNDPDGYTLTAYAKNGISSNTTAALADGTTTAAHLIQTGAGSGNVPANLTTDNTWGVSIAKAQNVATIGTYANYIGMGTSASPLTIGATSGPSYSAADQYQVKYGAKINMNQAAGGYSTTVTYTLTAKS
ncbi:MAG: hypothetical protein LBM73_00615 [Candidatus Nomurabacteria bacterium]|jgi:hypothetical protein|nr:hypothetical protein [Candidatus Nomurabacteria bacterium]